MTNQQSEVVLLSWAQQQDIVISPKSIRCCVASDIMDWGISRVTYFPADDENSSPVAHFHSPLFTTSSSSEDRPSRPPRQQGFRVNFKTSYLFNSAAILNAQHFAQDYNRLDRAHAHVYAHDVVGVSNRRLRNFTVGEILGYVFEQDAEAAAHIMKACPQARGLSRRGGGGAAAATAGGVLSEARGGGGSRHHRCLAVVGSSSK